MKKLRSLVMAAAAFVFATPLLFASVVSEETAEAAASGFLARSSVAQSILAGRSVKDVEAHGNLWIVNLEPSGYIEVAGSTKCTPIISFSTADFVEPEVGSPFAAKLTGDNMMVAEKEADESADDNAAWSKLTEPVTPTRRLLAAAPSGTTGVVGPLMNCGWGQGSPFNDLSPLSSLCGCMATAAGQEHRYWRWPYRYEKSRQGTHGLRNSLGEYSEHVMRPDGRVPFNYDKVVAYAPNPSSTPWATDKEATYQTAFLSLWMQSLTGMSYKPGASGGTQKLCNYAEDYWFERGPVMSYWRDGYTNLWNAIKADLDFGSPIQVNSPGHQMVVDGYAIENEGTDSEVHYVNINYGWGSPEGWVNLLTAVTESTSGGRLADFQTGYRPQKIVQFEPVPKVSTSNVTLKWHLPPCYTNRTTGFAVEIAKAGGAMTIDNVTTHEETTTYTATGLENGGTYTFTVIPLMSDGSAARSNSATTTIGTPKAAPEIVGVSSKACGIDLAQQGFYIECGRGVTNTIDVTCSSSVTRLNTYSSHLTVLPDNKVSTVDNGNGSWTINVDATTMAKDWDGDMLILTLVAANDDGTEAYKNLMLRFNSMRQELGGTYDIVETAANNAVWFCGTTTLDAKGRNVTFGAGAFCGTGAITLADSVGGGSFTFQGLDNFTGTLKWAPSVTVNLPSDMSNFAGTLNFDSYASTYRLARSLGSKAKVYIGGTTQLYIDNNVTVDAAITGGGYIMVVGSAPTFGNLSGFTGHISLGDWDNSGTVTIPAGQEKGVVIDNGTVNLILSRAQVAYGYSTSAITMQGWGSVVFKDESGNTLKTWTSSQSTYAISSSANTWTPDELGTGNFWDAARWSQGLPSAGDYVIFNDTVGDSEMTLNLASDFNLGYVLVTGTKLNISAASGSATLSVDTFRNTAIAAIATLKCAPTTVVPEGKLRLQSGLGISCDVDSSLADNMKWYYDDDVPAMYFADIWKGTVVFSGYAAAGLDLGYWANDDSVVRLNGVTGYLKANTEFPYTVELVDNGETSALNWSNGSSGAQSTFDILTGTGTFQTTAGGGNNEKVLIKDISGFTGSFNLAAKNVAIADAMPDDATGSNGRLYVDKEVEISAGKGWAANGGLYLGTNANLTVSGAFATGSAINTYGEGAVLTLEDGGSVKVNGAIAGDNAPTLNFKAGTYQITKNLTETKTVNFCAAAGKYTTLDANGNTFTLGANFFSGSGDVYLKTSTSGGAFVIQGIPAAYTGTIYVDNSIGLTISGDLSQMGGKINISDITLSRNSSSIGKIDVCSGATLQVVLTDDEAMDGLTVTGVTLTGGTIEFVDQRGTVVGSSTESLVYVKPEDYTVPSPEPTAIWYGDFSSDALSQFSGYTIDDWNETHGENYSSVTIDRNNQGLFIDFASAKGYFTVIVKYSGLAASSSYKRVLFATTATSTNYFDRCGIRLQTDSKVIGLWNDSTIGNNDKDYGSASSGTVPSVGTLAFVYDKTSGNGVGGLSAYVAGVDEALPSTALWNNTGLKAGDMYGFAVGGMCRGSVVSGIEAAKGMTITGLAIFDRVLTASELKYFRWPEESSGDDPEPEPTLTVSPASGAVAAGTKMTVTCDDPTATIWYKKYVTGEEEYVEYTDPVALDTGYNFVYVKVNDGEATLYTYIVAAPEPEPDPESEYEGPDPVAVWVAGEFDDDKSAHGGLEFALNGNTTNALGEIVIGTTTTLGAEIGIPAGHSIASVLVKYSIPDGAHVDNSVLASMFSAYDLGVLSDSGESTGKGYWYTGSAVSDGSYAFSNPAPSIPQDGYLLLSYKHNSSTAAYLGSTISTLVGGSNGSLHFSNNDVTKMAFGGPTVAAAKPWAGMVIKSVAVFLDEYLSAADLANYKFPAQGAVQPEDSDRYLVEPVVSWVNDFKTAEKNGCTLSVGGTTAAKDDAFGGVLTVGDSAAVIDVSGTANGGSVTVLVKYRATSATVNAPVVTFGETLSNNVKIDVGAYTQSARTLAVNRSYNGGNNKWVALNTAASLNEGEGYLLCARKTNDMLVYAGNSLDNMAGGSTATPGDISYSCDLIQAIGIGGPSGLPNADATWSAFDGFVVEKIVVFNGYYTPEQLQMVTMSIAANETRTFTAGEALEYKNIGTLSSSGTIAIANASELEEGTYPLVTWSTPQQYTTTCAGYGKVGTLVTEGLAEGLSARLVYGARGIYLRVDDTAKQAARKPLVVWCYGDSITEGYNAQATGANYRILLYQKLEMLGYNVRSTGVYGLSNGYNSVDPSGTALTDQYRWHSAKHGATAAPSSLSHRSNLSENVDTLAIQAGTPDVALLLIGVNDLPQFSTVEPVFAAWTNIVGRLVKNLPDTKIIVSTVLYSDGSRSDIDPKITTLNTEHIKPFMADLPEELQGHVFLADLNSYVKSGQPGIIYSDHLHPDWWGYDQMADGYLDAIIKCYPNPDATDFPSQNPIPAAPTADQLGAANKPELAAYRAGFTKLCNIRVEKGQDVSNVVYDDVNRDAVSNNIEKVGYFVEFVRDDNHAHKWVWVDMDAFGNADLASVGLPQRNYQQSVTRMHVCSNHGAIDNVAADDDSVTGWIEFSPYDYTRTGSNSAAPANYGEPFDWNDTLSESGSYGCMQVFRVMNPSSRDLYERPQLMFAFNNFQSANSDPADFGIGNFAQHFNCSNSYHSEDWTGVGGTLAKMAPDQYSVKTIEIWTKDAPYSGPEPAAVWVAGEFDDDRSAHGGLEFALNGNTTNEYGQIVIDNSATLGATAMLPAETYQKLTMLVKYSLPSGGAPAANSVPASMFSTYDLGARADQDSSSLDGYWLDGSTIKPGYAFSDPAPTIPQEGYILISTWAEDTKPDSSKHGTAVYTGEFISTLSGGEKTGLRFTGANNYITAVGVGGPTVAGAVPWAGMVIKNVAIFDDWVTPDDIRGYKFPEQGAVQPEDSDLYVVEPVVSWVNDFKTMTKGDYTLSISGTTAAKDDTFGGTLTIGNAAAIIDTTAASNTTLTVLIKYRAASSIINAPVVAFGGMAAVGLDVGVYTKSDKTLAVYRNYSNDNGKPYDFGTAPQLSATGGYVLCARDNGQQCMAYVGDSLDAMTGGTVSNGNIKFSNITLTKLGIGGNSGMAANANDMVPFAGLEIEKIVVFNGYYTPNQIRYIPNPEEGDTVNISDNTTWQFAATDTPREYKYIGTLSSSGTIAITNASELTEGTYPLATWSTPQQYTTQCAGYGKVGTLVTEGLAEGLSARLVYGARGIYLRVDDTAKQAARKPLVVWCYGDSITEGFNAQATGANYRILLYQKLEMLGYNVRSTGVYGLSNGYNSVDPSGTPLTDQYKWHSAKHGATAGPTTLAHRSNLSENVDTLAIQAGTPDVALLLIGVNDIPEWKSESDRVTPVFKAWTNVVSRMVKNLPDTKIVVSTILYSDGTRTDIDPTITAINTQIKNLLNNLPAEWQGHVVLADLNSYVKSGDTGIIYNDHLHPDWWGYDQMADGYLDAIVKCYPDPDAEDFPSQNPIPAAPTAEQLGAANKPELAAYRVGFKKLCNIRVEKGQDVSNIVCDDVNGNAASENIEKVGYFVEFVRDDNHAHKWVWVDMDAFGNADLASVGLPQRNYQQSVTRMHVCSNHGAIDNVAADDDSVTGWIEFSPYDYTRTGSNSAAPANYGEPFDWNDTLSESGSYGCMQVFRVMNPSSRDLYERPQLMFAFNNFQSANNNPADFGIGNFAQHFNCNNSYHTEDWTGVSSVLAKMAPDQYSVKRIEIWTKAAGSDEPEDKTIPTEGGVYPVPFSWIEVCFPGIEGQPDAMYETVAKLSGANGYKYWESYVLGLVPTNETSKFEVSIRMEGETPVVEYSPTNDTIAIQYILQGKPLLINDWQDVEFEEPGDTNRFFRVKVTW